MPEKYWASSTETMSDPTEGRDESSFDEATDLSTATLADRAASAGLSEEYKTTCTIVTSTAFRRRVGNIAARLSAYRRTVKMSYMKSLYAVYGTRGLLAMGIWES